MKLINWAKKDLSKTVVYAFAIVFTVYSVHCAITVYKSAQLKEYKATDTEAENDFLNSYSNDEYEQCLEKQIKLLDCTGKNLATTTVKMCEKNIHIDKRRIDHISTDTEIAVMTTIRPELDYCIKQKIFLDSTVGYTATFGVYGSEEDSMILDYSIPASDEYNQIKTYSFERLKKDCIIQPTVLNFGVKHQLDLNYTVCNNDISKGKITAYETLRDINILGKNNVNYYWNGEVNKIDISFE